LIYIVVVPDIPPDITPLQANHLVSSHARKVYAFADDGNVLTKMDLASLAHIKSILGDFGLLSGLECNVEKTVVMQVGEVVPISQEIRDLGFTLSNSVTILGLVIEQNDISFKNSWKKITKKVRLQINHWASFNLSLPGRINVNKTMLYRQVNYLGCFLPTNTAILNSISNLIESFVLGKLRVAKKDYTKKLSMVV